MTGCDNGIGQTTLEQPAMQDLVNDPQAGTRRITVHKTLLLVNDVI